MQAQIRLAKFNSKKKDVSRKEPLEDISLSNEMTSWLNQTFSATDEDGYLPEVVGSVLTQPLDSFAAFCPTGNLLNSKFSSIRMPSRDNKMNNSMTITNNISNTNSFNSTNNNTINNNNDNKLSTENIVNFDASVNRLNVLWLQRRANLEKEDGDYKSAFNTLQEALDLHIGTDSYEKSGITEPIYGTDPLELMIEIENNYFPYDTTSHRIADKLQRWYHRHYTKKMSAATIVQRKYRRYLRIRQVWKNLQIQLQCTKKIQRRFRRHLKRMHMLATKLKAWYRMRVKVKEFNHLIRFYRAARLIQRIMRGIWGRMIAARKKLERKSAKLIQRNARGYICRQRRFWALSQYHKIFYYAALKIQCFFRRLIAIGRCKRRLLEEIIREEIRMEKERNIRDETIQLEISRTRIYLNSAAGKLHYDACKTKILAMDEDFNKKKEMMSQQEILAHDAMIIFEIYDSDGSGSIDSEELRLMLIDLCVPVDNNELNRLVHQLDQDGSGGIDFEEFIDWYSNGGNEGSTSVGGMMLKQILRARRLVLDLSGETLRKRTERTVLRQCCSWLSNETKSMFRMTQPPKYNCCRCLQPFVLFTDYYRHFKGSGESRVCCITGERALFYPKFWIQRDWLKQRQCEMEIMRVTYEYPCLTYKAMMAVYSELAILSNPELSYLLEGQINAATEMYKSILQFGNNDKFYTEPLHHYIYQIANLCDDGFLSPNIAKCIGQCLREDLPIEWIIHERWSLEYFKQWLTYLPKLNRSNEELSSSCFLLKCCTSKSKIFDRDTHLLGNIFVRCVRLLLVGAETSLISLAEYRLKRPRRINITDGELKKMKLYPLTKESYDNVRIKLIKRLRIIRETLRKLQICSINYYKLSENRKLLTRINCYIRKKLGLQYTEVKITDDPTEEEIETYEIESAHIRAKAHYNYRAKTRIGKAHLQRVKYELWAKKKYIYNQYLNNNNNNNNQQQQQQQQLEIICFVNYLMNIFSIPQYNFDSIHYRDMDIIFHNYLYLKFSSSEEKLEVLELLDPNNTGFIEKENLINWLMSGQSQKYYNKWIKLKNINIPLSLFNTKDATFKILCDMRRITRIEIDSQKHALKLIDILLEDEEKNHIKQKGKKKSVIKLVQEDNEAINEKLKLLKIIFDKQEQSVLSRISEDDAEKNTKRKILFTSEGRYFLRMEILLMKIASEVIHTYGEIIPITSKLPNWLNPTIENELVNTLKLCLSILIYCFDTDCSSTFDESEITLLLKCVKCSISEKEILYHFPDVISNYSTISQVLDYLLPRVSWSRFFINNWNFFKDIKIITRPFFYSSSLLLISSARQTAREKSDQAAELMKTGILIEDDKNNDNDNDNMNNINGINSSNNHFGSGLLIRSQLLSMRQTIEFIKTPFGKIRRICIENELKFLFHQVIEENYSRLSIVQYVFEIHQLDNTGNTSYPFRILNSELPYIIKFLTLRFKWKLKDNVCQILTSLYKFTEESDARWVMFDEVMEIIDNVFIQQSSDQIIALYKNYSSKYISKDSKYRMLSVARQQSVLISIKYPDKDVKETNYRCFILGLSKCVEMLKISDLYSSNPIDWRNVPFESILIYLLAQGFTYHDLALRRDFYQSDDIIDYNNFVNPEKILTSAMEDIFSELSCFSSIYRMVRYIGGFHYLYMYEKYVCTLVYHQNEINTFGRMFLNEILTGVSHCSFE